MNSNEDKLYIKIVSLDAIYKLYINLWVYGSGWHNGTSLGTGDGLYSLFNLFGWNQNEIRPHYDIPLFAAPNRLLAGRSATLFVTYYIRAAWIKIANYQHFHNRKNSKLFPSTRQSPDNPLDYSLVHFTSQTVLFVSNYLLIQFVFLISPCIVGVLSWNFTRG